MADSLSDHSAMPAAISVAHCPKHGLHGLRIECFECGGPVEQVAYVEAGRVHELAAERDRLRAENEALRKVEQTARELDALFDKKDQGPLVMPGGENEWMLDGRRQTFDASQVLLILHDDLNDVLHARSVETDEQHPTICKACAGSGAQLCECDRGERPVVTCFSCSGRECAACAGTGHASRDSQQPEEDR